MKKIKSLLFIIFVFSPVGAVAAGDGGIPVAAVISQIANITLLVGLIYFTQRKNIAAFFSEKKKAYLESVEQASLFKKQAEEKLNEVMVRLNTMTTSFDKQVVEAKKNAEEAYRDQLATAKNEAQRIKNLALSSVDFETQKQIENLRVETYTKSALQAQSKLEHKLTAEQQKAWNNHFVSASGGVH